MFVITNLVGILGNYFDHSFHFFIRLFKGRDRESYLKAVKGGRGNPPPLSKKYIYKLFSVHGLFYLIFNFCYENCDVLKLNVPKNLYLYLTF